MHARNGTTRKNDEQSATALIDPTELQNLAPGDDIPSVGAEQIDPRPMRKKSREIILKLALDLFFVVLSLPPLLYALTTMHYHGAPLQEHRRTADILLQISQIVRTMPNVLEQS